MSPATALYDTDVYAWSQHQAALLREGAPAPLSAAPPTAIALRRRHARGSIDHDEYTEFLRFLSPIADNDR